jgi:rod shape-determining protein MreD
VKLLRLVIALVAALLLQSALGLLWPGAARYVDLMLVPVVWFGISGSQRTAMFAGCAAGLLQDSWFQLTVFGLNGFKKTAIGWFLGGFGSRFDLNRQGVRMACGALASIADSLMDIGLRRLLDQKQPPPNLVEILMRAVVVGMAVGALFAIIRFFRNRRAGRYRR